MPKSKKYLLNGFVCYPKWKPILRDSLAAAWLASYLYWWSSRGKIRRVNRSMKEIIDETNLGLSQVRSARKILRELGVTSEEIAGMPKRIYFTLDWTILKADTANGDYTERQPTPPKAKPERRRGRSIRSIIGDEG